jgi:hypothetical protein
VSRLPAQVAWASGEVPAHERDLYPSERPFVGRCATCGTSFETTLSEWQRFWPKHALTHGVNAAAWKRRHRAQIRKIGMRGRWG